MITAPTSSRLKSTLFPLPPLSHLLEHTYTIAFSPSAVHGMHDAKLDFICQQDDSKTISEVRQDQESIRKLDVVVVPFLYDAFHDAADKLDFRAKRPVYARERSIEPLLWEYAIASIEFKRMTKKKDISRPKENTLETHVPTKPVYMRVEVPVFNAPVTAWIGTSQTHAGQHVVATECKQLLFSSGS
jgi:hypothetical protein